MPDEFELKILRMISNVTAIPVEDIKPEQSLTGDLGMDSVASMELFGLMDETFHVEIDMAEIMKIDDVRSVIALARQAAQAHA